MAIKQGWNFGAEHGFTGSAGKTMVSGYARGGKIMHKAKGGAVGSGPIKTSKVNANIHQMDGAGKKGPDLNVRMPADHLAYAKGGEVEGDKRGGPIKRAMGGMSKPMGMPRAPVLGMKRTRHPKGMPGAGGPMPGVPGLPAAGTAPMGVPGAPGSPPRVMKTGGKAKC